MRLPFTRRRRSRRSGFTLIEMGISVSILGGFALMLVSASETSSSMTEMGNIKAKMFRRSQKAMSRILTDLRKTDFVTLGGLEYPHVFDGGVPGAGFEDFAYVPGPMMANPGDADFGVMRSIVLSLPSDLDGDDRPEIDANGNGIPELDGDGDGTPTDGGADVNGLWNADEVMIHPDTRLCWSSEPVAYVVTATGPGGQNELVRVVGDINGEREVLARGVERIQFDTPESSGFTVPTGTIQVTLFFRVAASDGSTYRDRYTFRVGTQGR